MNGCTSLNTTSKCKDLPAHISFSSAHFDNSLQSSSSKISKEPRIYIPRIFSKDTFNSKDENAIESLSTLSNKIEPSESYHELEGLLSGNTELTSTLLMSNGKENTFSKHSETQINLKQKNTETVENKDSILTTNNAPASISPYSSDGSSFSEHMFYAKAIIACILFVILATCICTYRKNIDIIALYEKGLKEIWKRLA